MGQGWLHPSAIWDDSLKKYIFTNDGNSPSWEFPARNGYVPIFENDDVYIRYVESFTKILAASATVIRSNEDLSAALPLTFTIDAQPDVPRRIVFAFDSHAQITAFTLTITGVNAKGKTVSQTFTAASGWTFTTNEAYATITSIILSARTGTGAGDTMDVGVNDVVGLANNIEAAGDVFKVVKNVAAGNAVDYSGAANITAEATYDTVDLSTGAGIAAADNFTIYYKSRLYKQS
jgi:hypothetical protein